MYTPEWVQVQGLCSRHYNLIRHYMRVKRTVMHLYVSITIPLSSLPGMVVEVDSSYKCAISFISGGFEQRMRNSDSTFVLYKMAKVSNPNTQVLTGPTWWWGFDSSACPVGGKNEFWDDQNHTVSPSIPGVGLNIDRCICPRGLTADLPTYLSVTNNCAY